MKILAVDTATGSCSVAITEDDQALAETVLLRRETHSRHLASMIEETVRMAGVSLEQIDGFAVTRGPGSFTGLRIGLSTIKGFVEASGRPVVGVSTLETLARQARGPGSLIIALIDGRRGEVFFSGFRYGNHYLQREYAEQALKPTEAIEIIREPCTLIGNGALLYQSLIREALGDKAHIPAAVHHTIRASTVAAVAFERFQNRETEEPLSFVPVYLRKSDAELSRIKQA